jgi:hypothetical protein
MWTGVGIWLSVTWSEDRWLPKKIDNPLTKGAKKIRPGVSHQATSFANLAFIFILLRGIND